MATKSEILSAVRDYREPARRAVALAYYVQHLSARVNREAVEFNSEHQPEPESVTGDYVSDLYHAVAERVEILSALVAELDKARAELDAASFPPAVA